MQKTLEQLRIAVALTQDQLAGKVGVNRITIASWENGGNQPRIQYIRPLAEALGVSFAEVYEAIEATIRQAKKNKQ